MNDTASWQLLPSELIELQIGQIDLLLAMYPEDVVIEESTTKELDVLRKVAEGSADNRTPKATSISLVLKLLLDASDRGDRIQHELKLDLNVPFGYVGEDMPLEPPPAKFRIQQPSWMSRATVSQLQSQLPEGEDLFSAIESIKEAATLQLEQSSELDASDLSTKHTGPMVRVWFYFPSISTRSKRDDFIKFAPAYSLTGFLYAGKPGLLCVEGVSESVDEYMRKIKTESWGDIPSHHKKVSERYREACEGRVFSDMTEITNTVGERHGQRANRGDMKALEEWLASKGLGQAFSEVLM